MHGYEINVKVTVKFEGATSRTQQTATRIFLKL